MLLNIHCFMLQVRELSHLGCQYGEISRRVAALDSPEVSEVGGM